LLSTSGDEHLLRPDEAVALAERACELVGQPDPQRLSILAAAYASAGRFENARATLERAVGMAEAAGAQQATEELHRRLNAIEKSEMERSSNGNKRSGAKY
jgi:hypothetical protein